MADFIADNFIIIVIIIGGLLSLLKNKSISGENDKQEASHTANRSQRNNHPTKSHGHASKASPEYTRQSSHTFESASIEEQQQKQLEELQNRMGSMSGRQKEDNDDTHDSNLKRTLQSPEIVKPYHHEEFKKEIKGKLNQKGLIDSIVMAEVLGPPRAKKPYSSIINKRK